MNKEDPLYKQQEKLFDRLTENVWLRTSEVCDTIYYLDGYDNVLFQYMPVPNDILLINYNLIFRVFDIVFSFKNNNNLKLLINHLFAKKFNLTIKNISTFH